MPHVAFRLAGSSTLMLSAFLFSPPADASAQVQAVDHRDVQSVEASTTASEGDASHLVDGLLGSPWISAPGRAEGERVEVRFRTTRYVTRVDVHPGHGRDNRTFARHARPTAVEVAWDGGSERFELEDRRTTQRLELSGLARTRSLTFTVVATVGPSSRGVAISEIVAFEPRDILGVNPHLRSRIEADVEALSERSGAEEALDRVVAYGQPAVPWLRDRLVRDEPDEGGAMALRALYRLDSAAARSLAGDMLREGGPARVLGALSVVAEHDTEAHAHALADAAERFETRHPELGAALVDPLARSGSALALPLLDRALASGDPRRVAVAVVGLPALGQEGLSLLEAHLDAGDEAVRMAALASLGGFGDRPEAVALARSYTEHASLRTREAAARALGRLRGPHARADLGRLVRTGDATIRRAAAVALVQHGDVAMPMLRELLPDMPPKLQEASFDALGHVDTPGVRRALVAEVVAEIHPAWYRHAVRALAQQGDPGIDAMLTWMQGEPALASRGASFLQRVASQAAPAAGEMLGDLPPDRALDDVRMVLLDVIRRAGHAPAAESVIAVYRALTTSDRVRRRALETLGGLDTESVRELVLEEMDSPNVQIAALARQAAGRLGERQAIPKLIAMLEERKARDWPVDAVESLGALGADEALGLFRLHLPNAGRSIQLAILRACQRIGGREALRILVDASVSKDGVVARAAQGLLSER